MITLIRKTLRIALVVLFLSVGIAAQARVYLVSVGISDYPGTDNDLNLPVKDAKSVTWLYTKNTDVQYIQLLNAQATVRNIVSAMQKTFSQANGNDMVLFFFSGHGSPGVFWAYDGPLDYSKVRSAMSRTPAKTKMIFADACFSGKLRTGKRSNHTASEAQKANVMTFLSSRDNETSIERGYMQNGLFTTCLLKGLRGAADVNRDRVITARELYDYVHAETIRLSRGQQHPVMWGNFPSNMMVMRW